MSGTMGSMSRPGRAGLASLPLGEQRDRVLASWDGFLAAAEDVDLDRPSRLPGWTGHDVLVHVGDWPGVATLDKLLAEARSGTVAPPYDPDAVNAAVVAAHRDVPGADVLAAVRRSRDRLAEWFAAPDAAGRPPGARADAGHVRGRRAAAAHRRQRRRLRAGGARARPRRTPGRRAARRRPGRAGRRDRCVRAPARVALVAHRVDGPVGLAGPDRPATAGSPPRYGNGHRARRSRATRPSCSTRRPDGARCRRCWRLAPCACTGSPTSCVSRRSSTRCRVCPVGRR